jgi:hypothetical protein
LIYKGKFGIWKEKFTDYSDIVPDHISLRCMSGGWRDDRPDDIQAVRRWLERRKGVYQRVNGGEFRASS